MVCIRTPFTTDGDAASQAFKFKYWLAKIFHVTAATNDSRIIHSACLTMNSTLKSSFPHPKNEEKQQ
jgi:hypothetical protein